MENTKTIFIALNPLVIPELGSLEVPRGFGITDLIEKFDAGAVRKINAELPVWETEGHLSHGTAYALKDYDPQRLAETFAEPEGRIQ